MKLIRYFIPLLAVIMIAVMTPVAASANPGLQVTNMILVTNVNPGETLNFKMTVAIGSTDPPVDISAEVDGLSQSLDGNNGPLPPSQDTGPYTARPFITLDNSSFHLDPGSPKDLIATIKVPQTVGNGGRYAIVHISTKPVPGSGVSILTAIDVPIVLTVSNSQLIHTGQITSVNVGQPVSGQPLPIVTTFKNTGNHHFKVKGEVAISDPSGKLLDTINLPLIPSSIVPNMSAQLKANYNLPKDLAGGVYSAAAKVMLEDGTILNESKSSFTIVGLPSPPASVTPSQTVSPTSNPTSTQATSVPNASQTQVPIAPSQAATAAPGSEGVPMALYFGTIIGFLVIIIIVLVIFLMRRSKR